MEAAEYETLRSLDGNEEDHALKIAKMTWEDRIRAEGWRDGLEEGKQQGIQQGQQRGTRRILLLLLGLRFGPLPEAVLRRVEAIDSLERLTELAGRVLVAKSLDELGLA